MSSITTRVTSGTGASVKNAPLSNAEIDNNFININTDKLEITDTTSANTADKVVKRDSSGNFAAGTITATAFTETSSITLKENINPIDNALSSLLSLNGVTYDRKDGSRKNEAGLIAEDVYKILPNIVSTNSAGDPEGINYTKLTAYLIEAVKELKSELDLLKGTK
jgi:hypothetical protein